MGLLSIFPTTVFILSVCQPASPVLQQSHYKVIKHIQYLDTTDEALSSPKHGRQGLISCASACDRHPSCTSVTFDAVLKTCNRNIKDIYSFGRQNMTSSSNVYYVGLVQNSITDGDWTLVFRAQANNSVSMWKAFTNSSFLNDHDMANLNPAFSSKYADVTLPHFRSRWLDLWPADAIDKVRVELYKDGRTDVSMTFNGTGSNQTSWFTFHRLLEIWPYTDLTSHVSWFTLNRKTSRMFYVSNTSEYNNCNQNAWVIVEDLPNNLCYWSSRFRSPRILYSAANHRVNFNDRSQGNNVVYRVADVLAVFVKFV